MSVAVAVSVSVALPVVVLVLGVVAGVAARGGRCGDRGVGHGERSRLRRRGGGGRVGRVQARRLKWQRRRDGAGGGGGGGGRAARPDRSLAVFAEPAVDQRPAD